MGCFKQKYSIKVDTAGILGSYLMSGGVSPQAGINELYVSVMMGKN